MNVVAYSFSVLPTVAFWMHCGLWHDLFYASMASNQVKQETQLSLTNYAKRLEVN